MVMGVIEKPEGNKLEEEAAPAASVESEPRQEKSVSPERTFTQKEIEAIVHQKDSEYGRVKSGLEKDRDSWKSKYEKVSKDIEGLNEEITSLQEKIDAMSSDDPTRYDAAKELKALREDRKQLKADRETFDTEKQSHAERLTLAESTLREIAIYEIAQEYDGGDPGKLKDLCDAFGANSDEKYRQVADKLWVKKGVIPNNGANLKLNDAGNGGSLTDQQIMENIIKEPWNPVYKKQYTEMEAKKRL